MRSIVLDTETTGLDPQKGHRIIEIGCIELWNGIPTNKFFQHYINPERDVPEEASAVSGIKTEFLVNSPKFHEVADAFLEFIADSTLVIHNARFDMAFLNYELGLIRKPLLTFDRVIDTLVMARKKFPGSPASLDALCKRFNIDLSSRVKHGALLDAELLSKVYLELLGGRQYHLLPTEQKAEVFLKDLDYSKKPYREPRSFSVLSDELEKHKKFVNTIKNPLWHMLHN